MMRRPWALWTVVCGLWTVVGTAEAATYYVATTGSDSNPGTIAAPFRTISKGVSIVRPGDTLYIRQGTYPESATYPGPYGSSWSSAVTVAGYPGETVVLNPGSCAAIIGHGAPARYVIYDNLVLDGRNLVKSITTGCGPVSFGSTHSNNAPDHIRLKDLEIKNSPWSGILGGGSFMEFLNLKVHDNGAWAKSAGYGPGNNGAYLTTDNSIVDGGEWYNNAKGGIRFGDSTAFTADNNVVRNALIHDNGWLYSSGAGIYLWDNNNAAYNNVIYHNNGYGIVVMTTHSPTHTRIHHNTIYNIPGGNGIEIHGGTGASVKNNIRVFPVFVASMKV